MPEDYAPIGVPNDSFMRLRDMEEKQRLLKERVILIGENMMSIKDETFEQMQVVKKMLIEMKEEQIRMKEFIQRLAQQSGELARKEEVMILQRQLNIMHPTRESNS